MFRLFDFLRTADLPPMTRPNYAAELRQMALWGVVIGSVDGALAGVVFVNVLRVAEVYWLVGIPAFGRAQLKPLAAAAIATIPALFAYEALSGVVLRLFLPAALFLPVYAGGLVVMGIEGEDRALLGRLRHRILHTIRPERDES